MREKLVVVDVPDKPPQTSQQELAVLIKADLLGLKYARQS